MHRLLFILVLAPTGACVADSGDEGILITKNVSPAAGCVVSAEPNEAFIAHGTMSSFLPTDYIFIGQMKSRVTALDAQIDQRTVFTTGANIDLSFPESTLFDATELADLKAQGITHFKSLFTAPILPNGGITDASFSIVPEALFERIHAKDPTSKFTPDGARFAVEVVASITVTGSMSGNEIESQPFSYPITISNRDVAQVLGSCPLPEGTVVATGNNCGRFQDAPVTCCHDADNTVVCPPTIAVPPPAAW